VIPRSVQQGVARRLIAPSARLREAAIIATPPRALNA
jgi:hypothetical protein